MASNWLHSVCIWPRFRYFTIRVYTQVIWNVCPYKYLQLDKAEQIHCHFFLFLFFVLFCFVLFFIPRRIIPYCSIESNLRRGSWKLQRVKGWGSGHPLTVAFWLVLWCCMDHTHTVTDGITGCVCADGSMLDRDSEDVQWVFRYLSLKTMCDWLSWARWQWTRSGQVCGAFTWRYNQTEAFGSGAVGGEVVQTFFSRAEIMLFW